MIMKQSNQYLREFYLDYMNNYISIGLIAEHHMLDYDDAVMMIKAGKKYHEDYVKLMNGKS